MAIPPNLDPIQFRCWHNPGRKEPSKQCATNDQNSTESSRVEDVRIRNAFNISHGAELSEECPLFGLRCHLVLSFKGDTKMSPEFGRTGRVRFFLNESHGLTGVSASLHARLPSQLPGELGVDAQRVPSSVRYGVSGSL